MPEFRLGESLEEFADQVESGPPPVVFRVQPESFVRLRTPEQLRAWEQTVRLTTGLEISADQMIGSAAETGCSYGEASHSDDCGLA